MGSKIKISLLTIGFFLVLFFVGVYCGNPLSVALLLLGLILHETAHWLFAELFGYKVREFKLTPLGGCMVIDSLMALNPVAEFVIALSGPFSNLLMVVGVCYLGLLGISNSLLDNWLQLNWLLGIVNLIPAIPLDGGRMLHALLKKITAADKAMAITKGIGLAIGGFFLSIGVKKFLTGGVGLLYSMTGFFLLYQVCLYQSPKLDNFWSMSERRKKILNRKGYAALKPILVQPGSIIRNILQRYGGDEFLLFFIRKPGSIDLMSEETAWNLLIDKGYDVTFQEVKQVPQVACQNSGK